MSLCRFCIVDGKCQNPDKCVLEPYVPPEIGKPTYIGTIQCGECSHGVCEWEDSCVLETQLVIEQAKDELKDNPVGENSKPTNPKDAIGSDKLPLHLWPETATALGCLGMLDGALKYGRSNFRAIGVRSSIYIDATKRHLDAYFEGEDIDPDSGLPHIAHALACLAILVDAEAAGKLTDDRQIKGGWRSWVEKLTPYVPMLKAKHADKNPRHFTIADNGEF